MRAATLSLFVINALINRDTPRGLAELTDVKMLMGNIKCHVHVRSQDLKCQNESLLIGIQNATLKTYSETKI
jgi:hypothetical protein